MNKKIATIFSVLIIVVFIAYMIFDSVRPEGSVTEPALTGDSNVPEDAWKVSEEIKVEDGSLKAVTVSPAGNIYVGGDSFVSCLDKDLSTKWSVKTDAPVTSLSCSGDSLFASTIDQILVFNDAGVIKNEWGPFEDNSIITSISSNKRYVAFADAGNKTIFVLDKGGEVKKLLGQNDGKFIVPSPYFDCDLNQEDILFVANTGHRRIETMSIDGEVQSFFGEPGTAPGAFCGCCNPAHFTVIPAGFITAEKGINRIKILDKKGEFVEFVSSKNKFTNSIPLDIASADGNTIYAANPDDSKLYIFTRK